MLTTVTTNVVRERLHGTRAKITEFELWLQEDQDYTTNMDMAISDVELQLVEARRSLADVLRDEAFVHWVKGCDIAATDEHIEAIRIHEGVLVSPEEAAVRQSIVAVLIHLQLWRMFILADESGWPASFVDVAAECVKGIPNPSLCLARALSSDRVVKECSSLQPVMAELAVASPMIDESIAALHDFSATTLALCDCKRVAKQKLLAQRALTLQFTSKLRLLRAEERFLLNDLEQRRAPSAHNVDSSKQRRTTWAVRQVRALLHRSPHLPVVGI
jgi:hypothetical protein